MSPEEIVRRYEALLSRAVAIVGCIEADSLEKQFLRVEANGDGALLTWPSATENWGEVTLETCSSTVAPASLLSASDEEFEAWRSAEDARKAKAEEDARIERKAAEKIQALCSLHALLWKYDREHYMALVRRGEKIYWRPVEFVPGLDTCVPSDTPTR